MIKQTYTYTDYNGNERTEDYYFDLREDELVKLELGIDGGMSEKIHRIIAARNIPEIIKVFDEVIMASYGEKSPDGREFVKDPILTKKFMQTKGYEKLFMDFVTKENFAADFFNALIPKDGIIANSANESNVVPMSVNK